MADIFLKFTGPDVEGESKDHQHSGWIEVGNAAYAVQNAAYVHSGSGASGGQATFSPMQVSKNTDKATATLLLKAASGQHFENAELVFYKAGGPDRVPYLKIKLKKVLIGDYSVSAADGAGVAMESLSLSYEQIQQNYTEQSDTGEAGAGSEFGWNVSENQSV